MSSWTIVLLASGLAYATKLAGYLVPGSWVEGPKRSRVLTLLPVSLLAGLVAKFLHPGRDPAGFIVTTLLAGGMAWSQTALYVGALGTFVSGFVMFACKKVAPLSTEDGGVHEHDAQDQPAAVQA